MWKLAIPIPPAPFPCRSAISRTQNSFSKARGKLGGSWLYNVCKARHSNRLIQSHPEPELKISVNNNIPLWLDKGRTYFHLLDNEHYLLELPDKSFWFGIINWNLDLDFCTWAHEPGLSIWKQALYFGPGAFWCGTCDVFFFRAFWLIYSELKKGFWIQDSGFSRDNIPFWSWILLYEASRCRPRGSAVLTPWYPHPDSGNMRLIAMDASIWIHLVGAPFIHNFLSCNSLLDPVVLAVTCKTVIVGRKWQTDFTNTPIVFWVLKDVGCNLCHMPERHCSSELRRSQWLTFQREMRSFEPERYPREGKDSPVLTSQLLLRCLWWRRSSIGADRDSGLTRPMLYPPMDTTPLPAINQVRTKVNPPGICHAP